MERYDEAWQDTQQALQIDATLVAAYAVQGHILHMQKRYQEALSLYTQAQKIEPDSPALYYQKGLTLHTLGRHIEAVACCDYALRLAPNDPRALSAYDQVVNAYRTADVTAIPPPG
jgi:tetratricopeptide (TPR) repeat protein